MHVPIPQIQEQFVESVQVILRELFSWRIEEQIIPTPVIEYMAPAPAASHSALAPVIEDVTPAPSVTYAAPVPVIKLVRPVREQVSASFFSRCRCASAPDFERLQR